MSRNLIPSGAAMKIDDADNANHRSISRSWKYNDNRTTCQMECVRCAHILANNNRCSRRSCYTLPYCWQHLVKTYQLRIGRTRLKDANGRQLAGKGVFACKNRRKYASESDVVFLPGNVIIPYVGVRTDPDGDGGRVFDPSCRRGVGAMIQTCGVTTVECEANATVLPGRGNRYPTVRASKCIRDGEEIITSVDLVKHINLADEAPSTRPAAMFKKLNYKCNGVRIQNDL